MKIEVIIPTLPKNEAYLTLCAQSLMINSRRFADHEIVISPAFNGEGTSFPQGQCQAVNRVAENSDADWLLVVNDDMYFPREWDAGFVLDDTHLCWSPNLIEPLEVGSAPPFYKLDGGDSLQTFKRETVDDYTLENFAGCSADFSPGFNLPFFIRKDVFETVGGYDTMYDPWGSNSDSDLQAKIHLAGVQTWRNSTCVAYHFGSKSDTFTADKQSYWQRNWDYFAWKWGFTRAETPGVWYSENLINLDELVFLPAWKEKYGKVIA